MISPFSKLMVSIILLLLIAFLFEKQAVHAADELPPGPDRYGVITEEYTKYTWWLVRWSDSSITCEIVLERSGQPVEEDVLASCGKDIHQEWLSTPSCDTASTDPQSCSGYYLHYFRETPATRQQPIKLAPPVVWVRLDDCIPVASTHRCDSTPTLVLVGEEPLPGYSILRLEGSVDGKSFVCDPICQVDLGPTDEEGIILRFWAYSNYGDSSDVFEARVRVRSVDDPGDPYWYVDVLSSQWQGSPQASCMQTWGVFPPVGGLSGWLSSPNTASDLESSTSYGYLAGKLISSDQVDVSACPDGGLLQNGYASVCGIEKARQIVDEWQDRFDQLIFATSQQLEVPAQLLKNLFSRESQFWPAGSNNGQEVGLGQMTENGADALFLWNVPFYEQFCPTVLDAETCASKVYPDLEEEWDTRELTAAQRSLLRKALVSSVNAACPDCTLGIDLERADNSVPIFAEMLLANCAQTRMVVQLNYVDEGFEPTYEDLWRFTLVNYNAGPGCLGLAVDKTSRDNEPLDWAHVSSHLTPACQGAIEYVEDVSK